MDIDESWQVGTLVDTHLAVYLYLLYCIRDTVRGQLTSCHYEFDNTAQ